MKKLTLIFLSLALLTACKNNQERDKNSHDTEAAATDSLNTEPFFKLSLAQWSLNEPIRNGEMNPYDFAKKAKELGFTGVEYVSQLYTPEIQKHSNKAAGIDSVISRLKAESEKHGVENLIIMVDAEGDLAFSDETQTNEAIENHKLWIDAAEKLGCHSIRVNLFGEEEPETWKENSIRSLRTLAEYAAPKNVNVIVENHGGLSSDAALLVEVMKGVNMENCGTLPDFGNFCLKREGGERWGAPCVEEYDKYKGVNQLMPYAKAVSAKSYAFDAEGNETTIDYTKMLKIVKDAGYTGYIGVEYEGDLDNPEEGIALTKNLLVTSAASLK